MSNIKAILSHDQALAVAYASVFKARLTKSEAKLWAIKTAIRKNHKVSLATQKKESSVLGNLYGLNNIPFIEAIFLTGSRSMNSKIGDIDLMIITKPNTLWFTRLLVIKKLKNLYKHTVCPNIFLDTNHLKIKEQNLYTAHEVLQAKCLFDRQNIHKKWLQENRWTRKYLPNAYNLKFKISNLNSNFKFKIKNYRWLLPLELLAFVGQYLYMKPKITHENVGWGFAFFHPRNLSVSVLNRYNKLCKKLL